MSKRPKIIIFTDLDGTFLDHHSYDYTPALPAVERLQTLGAVIVPTTSKTMAEIKALNLPFHGDNAIAENGMVTLNYDGGYLIAKCYSEIIEFMGALPETLRRNVVGFDDMSVKDVVECTGLDDASASLAKDRLGSEPFLWSGDDEGLAAFIERAQAADFQVTQGGRFYHLMGRGGKDHAVLAMIEAFRAEYTDQQIVSIALGDGPNDRAMLACVDYGVHIPNDHGFGFEVENPRGTIIKAAAAGPQGWGEAIDQILDDLPFRA